MKRLTHAFLPSLVCGVLLAGAGCDSVTSDRITQWKTTEKGPGKLKEALANPSVAPPLRAEAAAALIDIGSFDDVDDTIAAMEATARLEMIKTLAPLYIAGMQGASGEKARDARDGLFSVRRYLPVDEQKGLDAALMPSVEKDLRAGRTSGGRHSIDQILIAIGAPAGPLLVNLLQDPVTPYVAIADILVKVNDAAAREKGGAALVKRAEGMKDVPLAMFRALGLLGGSAANGFLVAKMKKGAPAQAVLASQALQQNRDPSLLPVALEIAGDASVAKGVRDEVFGLIEVIGGVAARDGLLKIIATDREEIVRYRAYEAALVAFKAASILPALEAFPAKESYKRDDVVDFLVKDILKIGKSTRPLLLTALVSPAALARMTGVLALESLGSTADAAALAKLAGDKGTVKGFPAGQTVGKEALRVAALLQKKGGGATP